MSEVTDTTWVESKGDLVLTKDGIVYRLRNSGSSYSLFKNGTPVVKGTMQTCEKYVPVPFPEEFPLPSDDVNVESNLEGTDVTKEIEELERPMTVRLKKNRVVHLFQELGYDNAENWGQDKLESVIEGLPEDLDLDEEYEKLEDSNARETLSNIMDAFNKEYSIQVVGGVEDDNGKESHDTREFRESREVKKVEEDDSGDQENKKRRKSKEERQPKKEKEPEKTDEEKKRTRGRPRKDQEKVPSVKFEFTFKENPKTTKVNKQLAELFADMEKWPNDRPMKQSKLEYLKDEILGGRFHGSEWASAYCEETNTTYRINGKHTSTVIRNMFLEKEDFPETYVTIKHFECPTLKDVAGLFSVYDPKVAARNKNDVLRGYSGIDKTTANLSNRHLGVITAGIAYHKWGKGYRRVPTQVQASLLLKNTEFVEWVEKLFEGKKNTEIKHILRMSCIAAMLATWKVDEGKATEFWEDVRDDSDDPKNSPRRVLYRWLSSNVISRGVGSNKTSEWEVLYRCLQAWNAWRADSKTVNLDTKLHEGMELIEAQ